MNSKKHKLPRRILAMLLTICMFVTMFPSAMFAVEDGNTGSSGQGTTSVTSTANGVTVNKYVTGNEQEGYELTLEAYASDQLTTSTTTTPLDIVLVLDVSGSMSNRLSSYYELVDEKTEWSYNDIANSDTEYYYLVDGQYHLVRADYDWWNKEDYCLQYYSWRDWHTFTEKVSDPNQTIYTGQLYVRSGGEQKITAMKNAVNNFIDSVAENNPSNNHRIGIVSFASRANTVANLTSVADGVETLKNAVNGLWANGATAIDYGLERASSILDQAGRTSNKVVVVFTDGEPNHSSGFNYEVAADAINTAYDLKTNDGVDIYSIGMFDNADPSDTEGNFNKYMNAISSNYPTATANGENGYRDGWLSVAWGNESDGDYYFAANSAESLESVFEGIADEVTTGTLTANPDAAAVLSDTLSQYFDFTADAEGSAIAANNVKYVPAKDYIDGKFTWREPTNILPDGTELEVQVELKGDTITVTGFDYKTYAASYNSSTKEVSGGKLVVTFPIEVDENAVLDQPTDDNMYPTNVTKATEEADNRAKLSYKSNDEATTNDGVTALNESPKVYVDRGALEGNGTDVTVQVYVNGQKVNDPLTYVDITRDGNDTNYRYFDLTDSEEGTLTADFNYDDYDCVDLKVDVKDDNTYILQGVKSYQSHGSDGTDNVRTNNDENSTYTVDNVTAAGNNTDPDCTIYLYTKYNVKYWDANGSQLTTEPYNDQATYIASENVTAEDVADNVEPDRTGEAEWLSWKNTGYVTPLTLPALPNAEVDGWYLGSADNTEQKYDANSSFSAFNETSDELDDTKDRVINFYTTALSSELTVEKTVVSVGGTAVENQGNIPAANVGDEIIYQIVVKNTGDVNLTDVDITDTLTSGETEVDPGLTLYTDNKFETEADVTDVSIDKDQILTYYAKYTVAESDAGKVLTNNATASNEDTTGTDDTPGIKVEELPEYTLTYHANGGSFGESETAAVSGLVAGTYDLWSDEDQTKPADVNLPERDPVNDTKVVFLGWSETEITTIYGAGENYGEVVTNSVNISDNVDVYAVWGYDTNDDGIADATQIIVTPADIIIYTGGQQGQDGFDGVVNEDGAIVGSTSLPEPGFTVILPYEIKDTDVTDLTFTESPTPTTRTWKLQPYDGVHTTVYKLVPTGTDPEGGEQDPIRVEFTKADGTTIVSSDFTVGREVNTSFGMSIYKGEVGGIQTTVNNKDYTVNSDPTATLTVRGTTDQAQYASVNAEQTDTSAPALKAADNTVFTINDSDVTVEADNVALLFDEIIETAENAEGNDRAEALAAKADDVLNVSAGDMNYDLKYLDLVDTQNGNAWVKASQDVTIYWPLPEGTTQNTEFTLMHFEGLHRDMDPDEVNNMIGGCTVDTATSETEGNHIAIVDVTEDYVVIETGANGFSPFALAWEADNGGSDNPGGGGGWTPDGGDDGPDGLNTEDHFSYIVGYAEDYRTGEPTDNEDLWPVKPNNQITRAEVATIFYRLLEDEVRDEYDTTVNDFSDVSADSWYNQTVSTLASMEIVKGYEDGTFRPNAPITRAEFGAIATRFFAETGATYEPGTFTDVTGNEWFANAIQDAVNLGLIGGYPDGTVRPNNNITRAEACAIVNRTLGRVPDADHLLPEDVMKVWPDNNPTDWFYADMQEATNGHEYAWIEEDGHEIEEWTNLLDKDWTDR